MLNSTAAIREWREAHPSETLYLRGADLGGANLRGANLRGADLGENRVFQVGPGGSRGDYTVIKSGPNLDEVWCGCFRGTLAEFEAKVEKTHGDNEHGRYYRALIALFRAGATP